MSQLLDNSPTDSLMMSQSTEKAGPTPHTQRPDIAQDKTQKDSWGDKYKHQAFSWIRNWGLNYFVNFTIAASLTYAFDTSKVGATFRNLIDTTAEKYKDKINPRVTRFVVNFMTRTQLLLCGGHALQPTLKWMKDNEKRLTFEMGHKLDLLQEVIGRGTEHSKRNIEEYHRVKSLVSIGDHNRTHTDKIGAELTAQDHALLAKHAVDPNLQFKEVRQTWKDAIVARLTGMACTTSMGILMGLSSASTNPKFQFRETYEKPAGEWFGRNVVAKIPVVNKVFGDHALIGDYFLEDAIFTAGSKFGFDKMEKLQEKKRQEKARKAKTSDSTNPSQAREAERKELSQPHDNLPASLPRTAGHLATELPPNFRTREQQRMATEAGIVR